MRFSEQARTRPTSSAHSSSILQPREHLP
jgi:hypothetical protein